MGQTILLADDSITIQKVIELTFSDEDFTLHTVGNGQKAIDEIRTVKPDIVLCDIIMPEKNGYEVCEFIKSSDDLKHIPVLLLTGAFEPFDQERARKAGCDGFLAKPFEPQTLISKVRELLVASAQAPTIQAPITEPTLESTPPAAVAPPPMSLPPEPTPLAALEPPPTVELSTVAEPPPVPDAPSTEEDSTTIMADSFAIEAGERELSVEPGDQTVLLNNEESSTMQSDDIWSEVQQTPPPPSPQPSAPSTDPSDDDVSTVFMGASPEPELSESAPAPAEDVSGAAGFDELAAIPTGPPVNPTDSGTWLLPSPDEEQVARPAESFPPPAEPESPQVEPLPSVPEPFFEATEPMPQLTEPIESPKEPELTPLGDFSGFDDFSAAEPANSPKDAGGPEEPIPQTPFMKSPDIEVEDPTFFESPDAFKMPAPEPPAPPAVPDLPAAELPEPPIPDTFTPQAPPALSEEMSFSEPTAVDPEPAPSPEMNQFEETFPMVDPTPLEESVPVAADPAPFIEEPMIEDSTLAPPSVDPEDATLEPGMLEASEIPAPVEPIRGPLEPSEPIFEPSVSREPMFEESFVSSQTDLPAEEKAPTTLVTKAEKQAAVGEPAVGVDELDVLAERVAEKVISKLSDKVIKEIAWEIVPDLAQTLIQKEIDELKAKIPE